MGRYPAIASVLMGLAVGPRPTRAQTDVSEVHAAAEAFLNYVHAFDYSSMRANATADFEILIFGRRMGLDEFEDLLRGMEEDRDGRPLADYELRDFNTEIVGEVAYTSWRAPNWLESAIFLWSNGRWRMDRAASIPVADSGGP